MARVLVTAFEPYDRWAENASWLALVELTSQIPSAPQIVTRRYPVDYEQLRRRLEKDLQAGFDFVLHLGQAPGSAKLHLEAVGLNLRSDGEAGAAAEPLVPRGPVAFRSALPLERWAYRLSSAGVPAKVSYHAGTYLCNAALYLSHYLAAEQNLHTRAMFLHVPLDPRQVAAERSETPSLPASLSAQGAQLLLEEMERLSPTSITV